MLDTTVAGNAERRVGELVTGRSKQLAAEQTVADARRVLANPSVRVVPVLDERAYLGAVSREILDGVDSATPLGDLAQPLLPTVQAQTPLRTALAGLAGTGATRLVVLDPADDRYVGLVCLRGDLDRLCLDAECHAEPPDPTPTSTTPTKGALR